MEGKRREREEHECEKGGISGERKEGKPSGESEDLEGGEGDGLQRFFSVGRREEMWKKLEIGWKRAYRSGKKKGTGRKMSETGKNEYKNERIRWYIL